MDYKEYIKRNSGWVKLDTSKLGQINKEDKNRIDSLIMNINEIKGLEQMSEDEAKE